MSSDSGDVSKNKTAAILSYILFFIPLLTEAKKSKFAMFHANQSLVLLIVSVAASLLSGFIPGVGTLIGTVVSIGVFVLWVMGIINASNGEMKPLPLIGTFTILKA